MDREPDHRTDVLGEPFTAETIELPDDAEGPVVATLVRLAATAPTDRAVLHVHGFADYFFQADYARWWAARGYTFYALDLRKYGRSLRPHQTPNYVEDLREHYPELDEAWRRITGRDGHRVVVGSAHSTGGLTLPLWVRDRRAGVAGLVLSSPWFDMQGAPWLRSLAGRVALDQLGARRPRRVIPRTVTGFYTRSLHREHEGEWAFDLDWKPVSSWPVHAGWLRAVRRGHARLHRGLDLDVPVLVLSSLRTTAPADMGEDVHSSDIVLDVQQIRRWASSVGRHVTSIAVEGARHDVVLSRAAVREVAYDHLSTWLSAWVEHR